MTMNIRRSFDFAGLLSAMIILASSEARAQATRTDSTSSQVQTVGIAVRRVAPNLAIFRLNFIAEGRSTREAGQRIAARADTLRRAMANLGVPRDSLVTASEWYWWGGRVETIVSNGRFVQLPRPDSLGRLSYNLQDTTFRAHDAIEVRISNLKKVGAAIDSALAHGVSDISPVQFQATDESAARNEALKEATEDARGQAELIATSGGMRLGRVISLSTQSEGGRYSEFGLVGMASIGGSPGGGTEVIPRTLPVSESVYGRWELIPRP
jgi:uncharacterized protein